MKKSKKLKILLVFIMVVLLVLSVVRMSWAEEGWQVIPGWGAYSKADGDSSYNYAFQYYKNNGSGKRWQNRNDYLNYFFNITWEDIKNTYYTTGIVPENTDDYEEFIQYSTDGFCLNHNVADRDGAGKFYVAAIVDIEGDYIKVYSSETETGSDWIKVYQGPDEGRTYHRFAASDITKAIYYMNNDVGEGTRYIESAVDVQEPARDKQIVKNWWNKWGYHHLYPYLEDYLDDDVYDNIHPNPNPIDSDKYELYKKNNGFYNYLKQSSLQAVTYYDLTNLEIAPSGDALTLEEGNYSVNNVRDYTIKMGPYSISGGHDNLNYTIKLVNTNDNIIEGVEGVYNKNDGYIYLKGSIEEEVKSVRLTASYQGYKTRLIMLDTPSLQCRMFANTIPATISNTVDTTEVPEFGVNVSLQKYITKVNGNALTPSQTGIIDRINTRTLVSENSDQQDVKDDISYVNNVFNTADITKYKKNDAVKINVGDKVTYRVSVYNNSNTEATNVTIKDMLPYYINSGGNKVGFTEIESIFANGNYNTNIKNNWVLDTSDYTLNYTIDDNNEEEGNQFSANSEQYFDITVKYKIYHKDILENIAWISSMDQTNRTEYRTEDKDYIKMEEYRVSLEKFITKVTNAQGENAVTYNDRAGKRYNEDSDVPTTDLYNKNPYKENNKVAVEAGDIVTYTIRLKNTGDNPVKITKIYDSFRCIDKETHPDKGLKLEFIDIQGNGTGNVTQEHYLEEGDSNKEVLDRYLIEFTRAPLLDPGDYEDVTIRFKVIVPINLTSQSKILQNKAGIVELKTTIGEEDYTVDDSAGAYPDGTQYPADFDNYDWDWIQTKIYAVSLEKYVWKTNVTNYTSGRDGKTQYHEDTTTAKYKYNNPVTVSNGNLVVYNIILRNDGDTKVKITNVADYLPNGVRAGSNNVYPSKDGEEFYCTEFGHNPSNNYDNDGNLITNPDNGQQTGNLIEKTNGYELEPHTSTEFKVGVLVTELNSSNYTLKNVAEIISMENRNEVTVIDSTPGNNKDADYIQLDYSTITEESEFTQFTVIKAWDDNDNAAGDRPESIKVRLYKITGNNNLTAIGNVVTLNNSNWSYTWTDLAKYEEDDNGNKNLITYTARELKDDNSIVENGEMYNDSYRATYSPQLEQVTITNKHTTPPPPGEETETTQFTVIKDWVDNNNAAGDRPESIKVRLYKETGDSLTAVGDIVTLNNSNWSHTWTDLPKYEGDSLIRYTARELKDDNSIVEDGAMYDSNYRAIYPSEQSNEITITNTYSQGKMDYTVEKYWELAEGVSTRPESVTVKLFKIVSGNEIDLGMPSQELSDVNNWSYTWKELPRGNYIAREISESGEIVKGTTKYNEYTVTEYDDDIEGITKITNRYTPPPPPPPEKTEFTVEKVWDDNDNAAGDRPESIKVRLYKITGNNNLTAIGNVVTLNNDNWSHTWTELPKYEGDSLIRYTARELKDDNSIVDEGGAYNDSYKAYYLNETNKTTITNKMTVQEDDDDLVIAGIVWNDLALDKTGEDYNGEKDEQESVLSGVKVMLYRVGKGVVATTSTNSNGEYSFTNESLSSTEGLQAHEKFIKGPKVEGTNRWQGTYYSYYVIFEYNGVTYTSTLYNNFESSNSLDSNAIEKLNNETYDGIVDKSRTSFNSEFNPINNASGIEYTTINESGYMPQSINKYNSDTMDIQSSTEKIGLRRDATLEEALKHVNLGLRGRDVFDLELTSNVYSTKVTVNGVDGQYNYDDNKVTVRRIDTNNYNYSEDTANPHLDVSQYKGDEYDQKVRVSDVIESAYDKEDETTGLKIEVTYKITVTNASNTAGTATKITNYYDSKYNFKEARDANNNVLDDAEGTSGTGYKSVIVTTPETTLNQSEKMEIYVVYELNDAAVTLQRIAEGEKLATFNMAEITEYTTQCAAGQTEYTRGLIDKDSAPGSVATEKVRLYPDLIDEDNTTVEYYFGGNGLSLLKYEDDTYATPTLYFVKGNDNGTPDNPSDDPDSRIITGKVFRDETVTNLETRIKTGNGIYEDTKDGEVGVYGATVQLIEQVDGGKIRYETTTDGNGDFKFTGFLPGNYIIRYHYGDTANTVLLNQNETVNVNAYSFNGEDYQSTNNSYPIDGMNILNTTPNFWYAYNEGDKISTAKDNVARRAEVTNNVLDITDNNSNQVMTLLNRARTNLEGETLTEAELNTELPKGKLIDQTKMFAETAPMKFTVEETVKITDSNRDFVNEQKDSEGNGLGVGEWTKYTEYLIENMNFGIAEVPVTKIDLEKVVKGFTIIDSTGQNILAAAAKKADGKWDPNSKQGDVIVEDGLETVSIQIEDEKLQGARLQVTYAIMSNMEIELNYDNTGGVKATIGELVDVIDNNLSYNSSLGDNSKYWGVRGTLLTDGETTIKDISKYSTMVNATDIGLSELNKGEGITLTLEKILSSTNSTIEEIISSTVSSYEYNNTVEITEFNYENVTPPTGEDPGTERVAQRDRIRTTDRYIIIPGVQHDTASSEMISITPPTGNGSMNITYYVIAAVSLVILAAGVFGIKKFVVNTKK